MSTVQDSFEGTGATVEEAVRAACAAHGFDPQAVLVDVIAEAGQVVPGERLSRAQARVRVEQMPAAVARGRDILLRLLELMGIEAEVRPTRPPASAESEQIGESELPILLEVEGVDLGILIGWRGESLHSLQTVLNLMVGESGLVPGAPRLIVDVARYRQRREQTVAQMARRLAAGVARTGRPVTLDAMQPYERRAVHLALADDPYVKTESSGVDADRRVTIRPAEEVRA